MPDLLAGAEPGSLVLDELGAVLLELDAGPGSLVLDELGAVATPIDAGAGVGAAVPV